MDVMEFNVCANRNVTYAHRVDDPANYNWCIVPESAYDAVLFAGVALLVACVVSGRLSAVWVLVAGALCEMASYRANLGRFGNSVALWLGGIHPGEVFFYTFLPPLLLDSAARVDFFIFKKVLVLSLVFAFVLVCTTTLLAVPLMLWGLGLGPRYGWGWADVALFNAMVASTDAVAVTSVLRAGGAPELLGALLEGESLFNDASGIVLFDIFLRKVLQARRAAAAADAAHMSFSSSSTAHHHPHPRPPPQQPLAPVPTPAPAPGPDPHPHWWPPSSWFPGFLPPWAAVLVPELAAVCRDFMWLVFGGLAVGLACGVTMKWALRLLQWRRLKPHVEVSLTFAAGYLAFYIANAYLQASGVIAVVVFGVYGAATGTWGLSSQARRAGAFDRFWDVFAFCINGLIFFLLGASAVNYLIRLGTELDTDGGTSQRLLLETLLMLPLMYITLFTMRGLLIAAFCSAARAINRRRLSRYAAAADAAAAVNITAGKDALMAADPHDHGFQGTALGSKGPPAASCSPRHQRLDDHHVPHHSQHPHPYSKSPQHAVQEAAAALAATPDWRGMIFATVGGLRGAVSLIMAQIVLSAISSQSEEVTGFGGGVVVGAAFHGNGASSGPGRGSARRDKEVTAQMVVWTSGFVLMSLVVNAPLLTPLMTLLRLNTTSPIKQMVRARAKAALRRFTANALNEMRAAAELADGTDGSGGLDMSLMLLRGVDWAAVERVVDLTRKLDAVFPGAPVAATRNTSSAAAPGDHPAAISSTPTTAIAGAAKPPPTSSKRTNRNTSCSTRRRRVGRSAASSSVLEPLISRDESCSIDYDRMEKPGGYSRSRILSYADSAQDGDVEPGKRTQPAQGKGIVDRISLETATSSRPRGVVRFQEARTEQLDPEIVPPADKAAAAADEDDTAAPAGATELVSSGPSASEVTATAAAPLRSVFGLPGAADETAAAIAAAIAAAAATGGSSSTPTATTSAGIGADGSSPQRRLLRDHVAPLLIGTGEGSFVAAAAAAGAPEPSSEASMPVGGPRRRRLSGVGVDAGGAEASASLLLTEWDGGGEADGLRGSGHASSSVSVCGGVGREGLGGAVCGGGSGLLRRALPMGSRERTRSRTLDEQFAALQLPDASGLLECPFASYAVRNAADPVSETNRRGPRESTSTAATISPRASGVGYLGGAAAAAPSPRHAAAAADGAGTQGMLAAVAPAVVSPRQMALPGFSASVAMPLPSRRREVSPLRASPSPSDLPVGPHSDISSLSRLSRSPPWTLSNTAADLGMGMGGVRQHDNGDTGDVPRGEDPPTDPWSGHHYPDQQLFTSGLCGVGGFADVGGTAGSDVGSGVAFAFAGHLGLMDSSPADEPPPPSRPARLWSRDGEAAEGDQVEVTVGQNVTVALGPATHEREVGSNQGNDVNESGGGSGIGGGGGSGSGGGGAWLGIIADKGAEGPGLEAAEEGAGNEEGVDGDDDDDERDPIHLMSSSAPAKFHVLGLSGAGRRTGKVMKTSAAAPARPGLPAGAQLETLDEEQEDEREQSAAIREGGAGGGGGAVPTAASLAHPSLLQLQDGARIGSSGGGSGDGGSGSGGGSLFYTEIARASSALAMPIAAAAAAAASPFSALTDFPHSPRGVETARSYLAVGDCEPGALSSTDASIAIPSALLPSAFLSVSAAVPATAPVATAAFDEGGTTVEVANREGGQRRLSDPGSAPARPPRQSSSESRRLESTSAAARRLRIHQTRMSPSFAIGVGVSGGGGATRHLSLNRSAAGGGGDGAGGAAITSVISSSPTTPPGASWHLARQPSSRWFSVAAADAVRIRQRHKLQLQQHLGREALEVTARPAAVGSGSPAAAAAAAVGRRTSSPGQIAVAVAADVAAGKGLGGGEQMSASGGAAPHLLSRRWASLQELAGQQRALDAFCDRDEERRRGAGSGSGCSGSDSGSEQSSGARLGSEKAEVEELMVEYRIRLLAGFKRFFHEQALEGVLSPGGMRLLCHCCDDALHRPSAPLDLWSAVEREVVGRGLVQWQAWAHLALRRGMQRTLRWDFPLYLPVKWLLLRPMRALAEMLSSSLSRVMLVAMEVAVELAAALSDSSPQLQWLRYAGPAGHKIWEELDRQGEAVRRFILDRVIEAPDRFQATQSHRAALALLRQQVAFVRSMLKTGLVDGDEAEALLEPIERRIWRLEARGPRWQQPTLTQVLASCALLRGVPVTVMDWMRAEGDLWAFPRGADLTPLLAHGGVFIVVMGTVRVSLLSAPSAADQASAAPATRPTSPPPASGASLSGGGTLCPAELTAAGASHEPAVGHHAAPGCAGNPEHKPSAGTGHPPQFYVGVGGVVGMSTALVGRGVPGMAVSEAVAEGNTLGKGPVVFVLPPAAVATVRARAAAGWSPFQALLLNMYRLVGGHVLERQRTTLVGSIAKLLTGAVAHAARVGGRARAARLRELLLGSPQSGTGDRTKITVTTTSLRRKQKAVLDEVYDAPAAGLLTSVGSGGAAPTAAARPRRRVRRASGVSGEGGANSVNSSRSGYDVEDEEDERSEDEDRDEATEDGEEEDGSDGANSRSSEDAWSGPQRSWKESVRASKPHPWCGCSRASPSCKDSRWCC
ncbi:hypothetical protein VaNZ11_007422 [Volvox africanus]|uniref:Cation/H+ exchanger transmembrane domain-containing protein n=1 Tax=Volvox africanus TaxID=51714 RepID=A0ABQ5S3P7_9CHLO|nr:hypothetical protein VaNZ11_007422 [Volvox africanus]